MTCAHHHSRLPLPSSACVLCAHTGARTHATVHRAPTPAPRRFGRRAASARTVASLSLSLILSLTPQATTLGALSRSRPVALAQNTRTPAMGSQTRVQHAGTLLRVHSVCFHRRMALKGGDEGADAFDAVGDGIRAAALQGLGSSSGTVPGSMDGLTTSPEEQADAAALKVQMRGTPQKRSDSRAHAGVLDAFPPVLISKEGRFKYVLIEASDVEGNVKLLVRGDIRVGYHVYCAQPTIGALPAPYGTGNTACAQEHLVRTDDHRIEPRRKSSACMHPISPPRDFLCLDVNAASRFGGAGAPVHTHVCMYKHISAPRVCMYQRISDSAAACTRLCVRAYAHMQRRFGPRMWAAACWEGGAWNTTRSKGC